VTCYPEYVAVSVTSPVRLTELIPFVEVGTTTAPPKASAASAYSAALEHAPQLRSADGAAALATPSRADRLGGSAPLHAFAPKRALWSRILARGHRAVSEGL
jgi:hypothetical protein